MMPDGKKLKLLIIEDNSADTFLIKDAFRNNSHFQYQISSSSTLNNAVTIIKNEEIDIIILDIFLPDSHHARLSNLLRIQEVAPELPIVIYSGVNDPEFALHCLESGAQDFLVKGEVEQWHIVRATNYAIKRREYMQRVLNHSKTA